MSNKRRAHFEDSERPSKKPQTATTARVKHIPSSDAAKPVVATCTAARLPGSLKFSSFSKPDAAGSQELLLQSSDHDTIDFVAEESRTIISKEKHLKHYLGVFDPATGRLEVTEAKRMIVRSHVRQFQTRQESDEEEDTAPAPKVSTRAALTEAFGTKKAKKRVQSVAENRLLARGGDDDDPLSQAMLIAMDGREEEVQTQDLHRANKPLPVTNTKASEAEDAYPVSTLVVPHPSKQTLSSLSLEYWIARMTIGKPIISRSRFVSNRVEYITQAHINKPADESRLQKVQILRYIETLLLIYKFLTTLHTKKRIPDTKQLPEKTLKTLAHAPEGLPSRIIPHFFPEGTPGPRAMTLFRATILALALHIPPPSFNPGDNMLITEPTDISLDLALEQADATNLFRELGCKIKPATETELSRWGLSSLGRRRDESGKEVSIPKPRFARLSVPLEFPKLSLGKNISPAKRR